MSKRESILLPLKRTLDHQDHPRSKPSIWSRFGHWYCALEINFDTYLCAWNLGLVSHLKLLKSFCQSSDHRHSFPLLRLFFEPVAMGDPFPVSPFHTELESSTREGTLLRWWRKQTAHNRTRLWGRLNLWSWGMKSQAIMSAIALIRLAGMDPTHFVSSSRDLSLKSVDSLSMLFVSLSSKSIAYQEPFPATNVWIVSDLLSAVPCLSTLTFSNSWGDVCRVLRF